MCSTRHCPSTKLEAAESLQQNKATELRSK